jgi:hypothetical protein
VYDAFDLPSDNSYSLTLARPVDALRDLPPDTIDHVATDTDGLTATSTRTIIIEAAASTATASSTEATTSASSTQ